MSLSKGGEWVVTLVGMKCLSFQRCTVLACFLLIGVLPRLCDGEGEAASGETSRFKMVAEKSPFSREDRTDLSVNCGGGKGVLVAPRWILTASHCITSRNQEAGKVAAQFKLVDERQISIKVDKVLRHPGKDLALLRLVRPVTAEERQPVLLLRETLVASDGKLSIKKVAGNATWRNIPTLGKNDNLTVPVKADRQGKAGTSGSPWLIHSNQVGDVLVGITHGTGRAPQVAFVANWLEQTVREHSSDELVWATKQQTLAKQGAAKGANE
jgi:hypothetical protein